MIETAAAAVPVATYRRPARPRLTEGSSPSRGQYRWRDTSRRDAFAFARARLTRGCALSVIMNRA